MIYVLFCLTMTYTLESKVNRIISEELTKKVEHKDSYGQLQLITRLLQILPPTWRATLGAKHSAGIWNFDESLVGFLEQHLHMKCCFESLQDCWWMWPSVKNRTSLVPDVKVILVQIFFDGLWSLQANLIVLPATGPLFFPKIVPTCILGVSFFGEDPTMMSVNHISTTVSWKNYMKHMLSMVQKKTGSRGLTPGSIHTYFCAFFFRTMEAWAVYIESTGAKQCIGSSGFGFQVCGGYNPVKSQ